MCPRKVPGLSVFSSLWPGLGEDPCGRGLGLPGGEPDQDREALSCLQKSFLTTTSTPPVSWHLSGP